jgi:hypothetical protein
VLIADGTVSASGSPTQVMHKCSKSDAAVQELSSHARAYGTVMLAGKIVKLAFP